MFLEYSYHPLITKSDCSVKVCYSWQLRMLHYTLNCLIYNSSFCIPFFSFFGWLHLFNIILIFSLMWPPNDVLSHRRLYPAGIYLLKFNNRNTKTRCEICSKLTIKTQGAFIVNFEHLSHLNLVFLLLTLESNFRLGSQIRFKTQANV